MAGPALAKLTQSLRHCGANEVQEWPPQLWKQEAKLYLYILLYISGFKLQLLQGLLTFGQVVSLFSWYWSQSHSAWPKLPHSCSFLASVLAWDNWLLESQSRIGSSSNSSARTNPSIPLYVSRKIFRSSEECFRELHLMSLRVRWPLMPWASCRTISWYKPNMQLIWAQRSDLSAS